MPFVAQTFTFLPVNDEDDSEGTIVKTVFLREHHSPGHITPSGYVCEEPHVCYSHVFCINEATQFETKEQAQKALSKDSHNGWTKNHDTTYMPTIKKHLIKNNLWGTVVKTAYDEIRGQ